MRGQDSLLRRLLLRAPSPASPPCTRSSTTHREGGCCTFLAGHYTNVTPPPGAAPLTTVPHTLHVHKESVQRPAVTSAQPSALSHLCRRRRRRARLPCRRPAHPRPGPGHRRRPSGRVRPDPSAPARLWAHTAAQTAQAGMQRHGRPSTNTLPSTYADTTAKQIIRQPRMQTRAHMQTRAQCDCVDDTVAQGLAVSWLLW